MKKLLCLLFVVTLFTACSSDDNNNDDINLKTSDVTLYYNDEAQIEAKSDYKITYSSENEYYASVDDKGLIKAGRVGETMITLTNGKVSKSLKVAVKAKDDRFYTEPNIQFGISRNDLINKLGTPDFATENGIAYDNHSTNVPQVGYIFDSNNKLQASYVLVSTSQSSRLGAFLDERYFPIGSEDYNIYFINSLLTQTPTMGIGTTLYYLEHWMVVYVPYNDNNKKSTSDSQSLLKKELDQLFHNGH